MRRAVVLISGVVQGVGYRYWTRTEAHALGLTGFVRNLDDGRVEAIFEGELDDVERMLELCRNGPPHADVENLDIDREEFLGNFSSFDILR